MKSCCSSANPPQPLSPIKMSLRSSNASVCCPKMGEHLIDFSLVPPNHHHHHTLLHQSGDGSTSCSLISRDKDSPGRVTQAAQINEKVSHNWSETQKTANRKSENSKSVIDWLNESVSCSREEFNAVQDVTSSLLFVVTLVLTAFKWKHSVLTSQVSPFNEFIYGSEKWHVANEESFWLNAVMLILCVVTAGQYFTYFIKLFINRRRCSWCNEPVRTLWTDLNFIMDYY